MTWAATRTTRRRSASVRPDLIWVCLTHVVHARVRGWAIVPSGGDG
jgi:hypothetical protein